MQVAPPTTLMAVWTPHHTTSPRKDARMIAVSLILIFTLLIGYALTGLPTVEADQ